MVFTIVGIVGGICLVLAYQLVSNAKLDRTDRVYHVMNLVGAFLLGTEVWHTGSWAALALQCYWALVAAKHLSLISPPD